MKKLNRNQQSVIPRLLERYPRGGTWMRMFLMLMIMMMSSAFAMAQETYGIKVAGEDITGYNRYDLTEISGVSGTVYFDPNTRTLTLDNATIEANDCNAILNETCDYLTIELIGTNIIDVTGAAGIYLKEETAIWSNSGGKLTITNDRCALLFEGCPLEINNCWLEVEGDWGISANDNVAEEVLTIRNSHVEVKGPTGSICDIANLVLDYCSIIQPDGALFSKKNNAVVLNGEMVTDKVVIEPNYGLTVAGVDVTKKNFKDLSVIDGVEGKMNYNPETKTLTMEDVTINANDKNGIWNYDVEGLKIKVVGNNTISSNVAVITINQPSNISGSGTLRLKSSGNCGLYLPSSLSVEGISLYTEGKWGIAGKVDQTSGNVLTICNAYVEATGGAGSILDVEDLLLDVCSITQPIGAAFDTNKHAVVLNGEVVTDKVVIESDSYGFKIADEYVTKYNYPDLTEISGVSGKAYFDPNTRTLTLDNATIEADGSNAILNETCDYLTIELIGTNTINVTGAAGINLKEETTIWSNCGGKLSVKSDLCALLLSGCPLEINNCWLEAEGAWGISSRYNEAADVLTIRNSHVEATGSTGSICDIANLVLDNCSIIQPNGAEFDAQNNAVVLNGEMVTGKVVIEPVSNGISDITVDASARKKGIYSVTGVKQTQQWNELPAGIYIVDGVKRVKR